MVHTRMPACAPSAPPASCSQRAADVIFDNRNHSSARLREALELRCDLHGLRRAEARAPSTRTAHPAALWFVWVCSAGASTGTMVPLPAAHCHRPLRAQLCRPPGPFQHISERNAADPFLSTLGVSCAPGYSSTKVLGCPWTAYQHYTAVCRTRSLRVARLRCAPLKRGGVHARAARALNRITSHCQLSSLKNVEHRCGEAAQRQWLGALGTVLLLAETVQTKI